MTDAEHEIKRINLFGLFCRTNLVGYGIQFGINTCEICVTGKAMLLVSIYDKEKDREVIWQGDPRFWGRHAPVLFPNVGKHYGNHYRIGDKEYASKQHGFARDTDFT